MRKVFIVMAGGNIEADRHFEDTIQNKRSLTEVKKYLSADQSNNLENIYHRSDFIVWGSVPGPMNERRWESMEPGDVVLIYNKGFIKAVGEVAAKVRNKELARYFWKENPDSSTWELMYFIVNEQILNVPFSRLNPLLGYKDSYLPQGFSQISEEKVEEFSSKYGDLVGVLESIDRGDKIAVIPRREVIAVAQENTERATTEHDEMQWRLIRLGQLAKCDVWIPKNDQSKSYDGMEFRSEVLADFKDSLDVPLTIKNIDVVWKFGPYSIKSAFEIEHSTSVYSGILRLSDLRTETPNSVYPLFIVADKKKKIKVLNELRRPTFSGPCLRLNEVIKYISYDDIREIDKKYENKNEFDSNELIQYGIGPE